MARRCYACGRAIPSNPCQVDTLEDQWVWVGPECFRKIGDSGAEGYQPPKGGPRLYSLTAERVAYFRNKGMML